MFEVLFRIIAQVESNREGQLVTKLYESFMRQVDVGDIFTVQFRVQHL